MGTSSITSPLAQGEVFRNFKLSKRFDQDISAVMMAAKFTVKGQRIASARLAFGGMAATPKRAATTETALTGQTLEAAAQVVACLAKDFAPISDMRASASYRMEAAQGLLRRALLEVSGASSAETRITGLRQGAA